MKILAPVYYQNFRCIADRCKHSCCVGWEIDIDSNTLERYRHSAGGYCNFVNKSIEYSDIPHFRLLKDEKCPHLDGRGLCRIITELGEQWLSDICREHPRFYNETPRGKEVGVGLACEEACRLILESPDYQKSVAVGEISGEVFDFEIDTVAERESIYLVLSDYSVPYEKRLLTLWNRFEVSPKILSDDGWREIISSLEYLSEDSERIFSVYSSQEDTPKEYEIILERFLAYLIYRHATPQRTKEKFRAALGFAFFLERLFASVLKTEKKLDRDRIFKQARVISEELEYSEENTDTVMLEFEFI